MVSTRFKVVMRSAKADENTSTKAATYTLRRRSASKGWRLMPGGQQVLSWLSGNSCQGRQKRVTRLTGLPHDDGAWVPVLDNDK